MLKYHLFDLSFVLLKSENDIFYFHLSLPPLVFIAFSDG